MAVVSLSASLSGCRICRTSGGISKHVHDSICQHVCLVSALHDAVVKSRNAHMLHGAESNVCMLYAAVEQQQWHLSAATICLLVSCGSRCKISARDFV